MTTASISAPSGYAPTDDYFATVSEQGVLRMIGLSLTWRQIAELVGPVDPNTKSDYNRPLFVPHAKQFGQYVDITDDAFTPSITLFTDPANVSLVSLEDETLDEYGLRVAKIARGSQIYILDGQHRIYGIELLYREVHTLLDRSKQEVTRARNIGDDDAMKRGQKRVKEAQKRLDRLDKMQITVQILLTGEGDQAQRIFSDVADNAKGISRSQLADFSDRSVFNRVARDVSATLLQGVVDPVHDRMSSKNPYWIALKDVVNVAQAVEYTIGRRWTIQRESELVHREAAIENMTRSFFEGLIELYPEIGAVIEGTLSPTELRAGGSQPLLLGSATMIRSLASAYRRLRNGERAEDDGAWIHKPLKHAEIVTAWETVLPPMRAGHVPDPSGDKDKATPLIDGRWISTTAFSYPFYAPGANSTNLNSIADAVAKWTWEAPATD